MEKDEYKIRMDNLSGYIERKIDEVEVFMGNADKWVRYIYLAWLVNFLTIVVSIHFLIDLLSTIVLFVCIFNSFKEYYKVSKVNAELDGVFETLRLLGILSDEPPQGKKKKKDKVSIYEKIQRVLKALKRRSVFT